MRASSETKREKERKKERETEREGERQRQTDTRKKASGLTQLHCVLALFVLCARVYFIQWLRLNGQIVFLLTGRYSDVD